MINSARSCQSLFKTGNYGTAGDPAGLQDSDHSCNILFTHIRYAKCNFLRFFFFHIIYQPLSINCVPIRFNPVKQPTAPFNDRTVPVQHLSALFQQCAALPDSSSVCQFI